MKKRSLAALLCSLFAVFALGAQAVYQPARKLYTLKTEHFTIIYPEESRSAAQYLKSIAEGVYDEASAKLKVSKFPNIPVMITPDSEELDGETSFMPLRITLYQAPISPNSGFALFNDELKKLFMHELTHALSLSIRSPFWQFLAGVFCDGIVPVDLVAPESFVEGVAVSFESADGFGRAADTPYAAAIRQDILEGKFKSFNQATGAWDHYPFDIYYVYGGCFSRYLQATYGMDKYAELWQEMGKGHVLRGLDGLGPFKGDFEKVYGIKLDDAWKAFGQYMALKAPVVTQGTPIGDRPDSMSAPLASDGRHLYWADMTRVWRYDVASGKRERLFDWDGTITRLSPSADGRKLLVSAFRYKGDYPKDIVGVYDLESRRWEKAEFPSKLAEAVWLPDGSVIASRNVGYGQDLVRLKDGKEELLFHGTERLTPGQAYPYGENGIVFVLCVGGVNSIARMDLATRRIELLKSRPETKRLRYLYSDGSEIAFSFDSDDSLLKLARFGKGGLELEETLVSGGVQSPVLAGGSVYYVGAFSDGQQVLRYPEGNPALALKSAESSWEAFSPAPETLVSVYDAPEDEGGAAARAGGEGTYHALPYLFKPTLWYPLLNLNDANGDALNGAGAHFESMDPTQSLSVSADACYLWNSGFADAALGLGLQFLPIPLTLKASDSLAPVGGAKPYGSSLRRSLSFSAGLSDTLFFVPATRSIGFDLLGSLSRKSFGPGTRGDADSSPYSWASGELCVPVSAGVLYSDKVQSPFDLNGAKGFSLGLSYDGYFKDEPSPPEGLMEGSLALFLPCLNFKSSLYAAVAAHRGVLLGTEGPLLSDGSDYLGDYSYPAFKEYSDIDDRGDWLYFLQDTGVAYKFRTDASLPFDLYMRSVGLGGGYRRAMVDWKFYDSAYADFTYDFSLCRGVAGALLPFTLRLEYAKPLKSEGHSRFSADFAVSY
jgi:hypothetical protein